MSKFLRSILVACAVSPSYAAQGCERLPYRAVSRLRTHRGFLASGQGGQARVFAVDGSEFTAGQARWLQGSCTKSRRPAHAVTRRKRLNSWQRRRNC